MNVTTDAFAGISAANRRALTMLHRAFNRPFDAALPLEPSWLATVMTRVFMETLVAAWCPPGSGALRTGWRRSYLSSCGFSRCAGAGWGSDGLGVPVLLPGSCGIWGGRTEA